MKNISVLVVEDSHAQREYLLSMCREFGLTDLWEAENGRVALTILEQLGDQLDVLICDLEMPDIDGIELIHLLAMRKQRSAILIVSSREPALISAVELMATTEGLQVLGSLQKPVSQEHLLSILEQYNHRSKHELKEPPSLKTKLLTREKLQLALQEQRFVLHYQPQVDMKTFELKGVEALVRLNLHHRLVFPDDFIHLCEEYDLIDALSYEVVRLASEQQINWKQHGFDTKIAINLSAKSFHNDEFSKNIMDLLKATEVPAKQLCFEVTETSVIEDMGRALAFLARLRLSGSGLSIDDYGTGYSSVQQLSRIPFTELKVDRSLIKGIASKSHLQVIFESTLQMCNKLGLTVVAEGIEHQDDWNYLAQAGCHVAQGYFISPPMPEDKLIAWWKAGMTFLR